MSFVEVHKRAAARSQKYAEIHSPGCPVHDRAISHIEAVERMVDLDAEGRQPSSTRVSRIGRNDDIQLLPAGDGDREMDCAILDCQLKAPMCQVDGFGDRVWTYCTCGNQRSF